MAVRYIVQRGIGGQVLSFNAPGLTEDSRTTALSGAGSVKFLLTAAEMARVASDGQPMYLEQGTLIAIEEDKQLRFRGIVWDITYVGPHWSVEVPSVGTYPYDTPYEGGAYYGAEVDPADIFRKLWEHVQSFPDSDLGVTVVGSTPVRVGSLSTHNKNVATAEYNATVRDYKAANAVLSDLRDAAARGNKDTVPLRAARTAARTALTAAKRTKDAATIATAQRAFDDADRAVKAQETINTRGKAAVDEQSAVVADKKHLQNLANQTKKLMTKREQDDGGAYKLLPWDAPDCGRVFDSLAEDAPLDWYEEHYWDGDTPATRIVVAYPRTGRRLNGSGDPSFRQGRGGNIVAPLKPASSGDDTANSMFGVGAGEGSKSIRRSMTKRNGRLRRVATFQDKTVRSDHNMDVKLRAELNARIDTFGLSEITVKDHPNAPRGSYSIGDEIFVQGRVSGYGRFEMWHRILKITDQRDGRSVLSLARSDSFTYGRGFD